MSVKRKYDELIVKDIHAVFNLLADESEEVKCAKQESYHYQLPDSTVSGLDMTQTDSKDNLASIFAATRMSEQSGNFADGNGGNCYTITKADLYRVIVEFMDFYERLDTADIPSRKPNYSYTELIFLALMRSPNFCLPIHEIYRYMKTRFSFFRVCKKENWKSGIRHSLSKTRCFTKIGDINMKERSGNLKRPCYLWTIVPQSLSNFARGDYRLSGDKGSKVNILKWAFNEVDASEFWKKCSETLKVVIDSLKEELEEGTFFTEIFQQQLCRLPHDTHCNWGHTEEEEDEARGRCVPYVQPRNGEDEGFCYRQEQYVSGFTESCPFECASSFFVPQPTCSPSTSESDSDLSWTSTYQDSGLETLSEISGPTEMYGQFDYYQPHHYQSYVGPTAQEYTVSPTGHNCAVEFPHYIDFSPANITSLNPYPPETEVPPESFTFATQQYACDGYTETGSTPLPYLKSPDMLLGDHESFTNLLKEDIEIFPPAFPGNTDATDILDPRFISL